MREVRGAVERHVLEEVREALLILVLEHGAGVHCEPQLDAMGRRVVGAQIVTQPVGQRAHDERRVAKYVRSSGREFRADARERDQDHAQRAHGDAPHEFTSTHGRLPPFRVV